jgi:hypothetical protein
MPFRWFLSMALRKSNVRVGSNVIILSLISPFCLREKGSDEGEISPSPSYGPSAKRGEIKKAVAGAPQPKKTKGEDLATVYRRTTTR